jgi:chromosome segregation ATPase
MKLLFLAQVESENCEEFLPRILGLAEDTKTLVAEAVEELRQDPRVDYVVGTLGADPIMPEGQSKAIISNLESRLNEATMTIEESAQVIRTLRAKQEELQAEQNKSKILIAHLDEKLEDGKAKVESMSGIQDELERTRESLASSKFDYDQLLEMMKSKESSMEIIETYRASLSALEEKLRAAENTSSDEIVKLKGELLLIAQEKEDIQFQLMEAQKALSRAVSEAENKEQELGQFIMTAGTLGGQLRDRVIRTLQEQLVVRDEELEVLKQQRSELHEENRKGERFLVSAVHAIAMRYHEEMVQRFQENDCGRVNRQESPEDFYSQEYNNS